MDLEKLAILRADGGRLAVHTLIVQPQYADALVDELASAATPDGEGLVVVRALGEELTHVPLTVEPDQADRIIGDALTERVL